MVLMDNKQYRQTTKDGVTRFMPVGDFICPVCDGVLSLLQYVLRMLMHGIHEPTRKKIWCPKFKCDQCHHSHRGLPDVVIPYKRYDADTIFEAINSGADIGAMNDNTVRRWRTWWSVMGEYFVNIYAAICARLNLPRVPNPPHELLIRIAANANKWTFTGRIRQKLNC